MPRLLTSLLLLCLLLATCVTSFSQPLAEAGTDTTQQRPFRPGRLAVVLGAQAAVYGGTMAVLYGVWYKDHERAPFHFYNDNRGWMQQDKLGHFYSAYVQSYAGLRSMQWAGVSEKKAIWLGGSLGIILQTPIEILDGISAGWGASAGDLIANTAGSALLIGQELAWSEQRLRPKFSFSPSPYAQYRPGYFGTSFGEQFIRDYNGHTYWLSANVRSFVPAAPVPRWLNVAVGMSAGGMLGEFHNPRFYRGQPLPEIARYRQFLFSLDADLTRIRTRNKFLKALFEGLNLLKVPFPALQYNTVRGVRVHGVYY